MQLEDLLTQSFSVWLEKQKNIAFHPPLSPFIFWWFRINIVSISIHVPPNPFYLCNICPAAGDSVCEHELNRYCWSDPVWLAWHCCWVKIWKKMHTWCKVAQWCGCTMYSYLCKAVSAHSNNLDFCPRYITFAWKQGCWNFFQKSDIVILDFDRNYDCHPALISLHVSSRRQLEMRTTSQLSHHIDLRPNKKGTLPLF